MRESIESYVEGVGGVVGVGDLSAETDFSEARIRDWAYEHDVPMLASAYAFTAQAAADLVEDLEDEDEDDDEDEEIEEDD